MKKTLLVCLAFICVQFLTAQYCGSSGTSICTNSSNQTKPGFLPTTLDLHSMVNGQQSQVVLDFLNFDTITALGQTITIHTLKFDSINGLPNGLCWSTSSPDNTFCNGANNPIVTNCPFGMPDFGCIRISGTTCDTPGIYKLRIKVFIDVGFATIPYDYEQFFYASYYIRVRNPSENDVSLDTTQTADFVPYGTSPDCSLQPIALTLGGNQTVCTGSLVTLNPILVGGFTPYTYAWSSTANNLSCNTCKNPSTTINQAAVYSLTVTDANSNTVAASVSYTTNGGANLMQLALNGNTINCTNPISNSTATITNGSSPFIINWGDGTVATTGSAVQQHSYTQGGGYVITVSDNAGCVSSALHTVAYNGIVVSQSQLLQPACVDISSGLIKVNASGGTAPYAFLWSTGAVVDSIKNVTAGMYSITVTDVTSCSTVQQFNLAPLTGWGYYTYINATSSTCNNNGSIASTVYGGTAPYSYTWNNGSISANLVGLPGGSYSLTVTDATGCTTNGATMLSSSCYSLINGVLFNDTNSNCLYNLGEAPISGMMLSATASNGQKYYGNTSADGTYSIQVPTSGTYNLNVVYSYGNCGSAILCNNNTQTVTIQTLGDTSSANNIGFYSIPSFNLGISLSYTSGNPGFTKTYKIMPFNNSSISLLDNATVSFIYDTALIYQSSNFTATHNPLTHTLSWAVSALSSNSWDWQNRIEANFLVPLTVILGQQVKSQFTISPTVGDCDSSNNHLTVTDNITGSFDPNEKKVLPAGPILEEDSVLTYTIGFQNTGTDSTHFIILKDTLSAYLDPASVRNIVASHRFSDFEVSGQGILTWTFNPLRLVDSFTNEPASHGFVTFTIKKKSGLPLGTLISNTASIYFDYNEAVVTNTVVSTLSEPTYIFEAGKQDNINVTAFPNPFSNSTTILVNGLNEEFDFNLFDVSGRLVNKITSIQTNRFQLNKDELSSGVYFYKLSTKQKNVANGKLIIE